MSRLFWSDAEWLLVLVLCVFVGALVAAAARTVWSLL